jgi:hypothetical protein
LADPRVEFLDSLDLNQTRIKNFPGFIFLCGGPVPEPVETKPYKSLRHHLRDHIRATQRDLGAPIVVAESFAEWLKFDTYSDLIVFEQHLAGVANLVPIILESAGAIAEFAAFSQGESIKDKLLIFRQGRFAGDPSFINYGLINFLQQKEKTEEKFVQTYPWVDAHEDGAEAMNAAIVTDIANDIERRAKENKKKRYKFRIDDPGHIMVLIEDLSKLMLGLNQDEIVRFLKKIGIKIDAKTAAQYLFLLKNLEIIGDQHYGSRFYFSKNI